jgi:carbonic anhydrase
MSRHYYPRHNVLLLSCMDLRLIDNIVHFMDVLNMTNRYDQFILAGAALGVNQDKFPEWSAAFWSHLRLAIELHDIRDVFIMEHRHCGAYAKLAGLDFSDEQADSERDAHAANARKLTEAIRRRIAEHPKYDALRRRPVDIAVTSYLMDLGGGVDRLDGPVVVHRGTGPAPAPAATPTDGKSAKRPPRRGKAKPDEL